MPAINVIGAILAGGIQVPLSFSASYPEGGGPSTIEIGASDIDTDIFLADATTADLMYVGTDQTITVKINGSATAHTIDAGGFLLMAGSAVTAITASGGGTAANVTRLFVGT